MGRKVGIFGELADPPKKPPPLEPVEPKPGFSLKKGRFELLEEYRQRLEETFKTPLVVGTARAVIEQYDVDKAYLPIKIEWTEWFKELGIRLNDDFYIRAEREVARKITNEKIDVLGAFGMGEANVQAQGMSVEFGLNRVSPISIRY